MKTVLALVLLYLGSVSAAPTRKAKEVECRDQYGHCSEWSKEGYCNKAGYKTYMTLMCPYSCNTCQALQKSKEPEEDIGSASGLKDSQLDNPVNPTDIQETTEGDEDTASANEPISGEGEIAIQGDSESHENKEEAKQVDKLQNEQRKDAALESQNKPEQSTKRQQRKSVSEEINKDHQDAQEKKVVATQDRDPPGVQEVTFQENADDEVNPRSKISTRPNDNVFKEPKVQKKEITEKQDEDVSASGMLDESGEGASDEKKTANPKTSDKSTDTKGTSEESEEMKDLAGDIKTGSKIFEAEISEPESTSGCSSGFGCFSGNGEQVQTDKGEEAVELEPRSKIAEVPSGNNKTNDVPSSGTHQMMNSKSEENGQTMTVEDGASGSGKDVDDDIQKNDEKDATEPDDIAGGQAVTDSNSKVEPESNQKNLKTAKSDDNLKVDEQKSTNTSSDGSGADVNDDIRGKSVEGNDDESIDGTKATVFSDSFSGSGTGETAKPEPPKQVQNETKSDAENEKPNKQQESMKEETAKTASHDEEQSIAKNDEKEEDMNGKKENLKDAVVSEDDLSDNQSATKSVEKTEDANEKKEDMKDKTETKANENVTKSEEENEKGNQEKDDMKETAAKSEPSDNQSADKSDKESEEVYHEKEDMKDAAAKSESPSDNQSVDKSIAKNEETNEQKEDMKEPSSGSGAESNNTNQSTDKVPDKEDGIDETKSNTKSVTADREDEELENDIEDALSIGPGQPGKDSNEDLSSPKTRQRIKSMEQLMHDEKPTTEKEKDVQAKARESVPKAEESQGDFISSELGRGQKVKLILDQHYYKPYSNEDSMAYEMLALDLKKEVERAVGNQAIASQISFSEIRKPGKLPRYSRVLASFMLHGNRKALRDAVRKGVVGDMMVDKHFFQSS